LKANLRVLSACIVGAIAVSGCGASSGSNSLNPNKVINPNSNILQLAVGTANIYGTSAGLNVVTTYRQPRGGQVPGDSGSLVNSPTFAVPSGFNVPPGVAIGADPIATIVTGPTAAELAAIPTGTTAGSMTSTSQTPPEPTNTTETTFGQAGGVFGLGIEPFNYTSSTGTPFSVNPYPVPLYDALAGSLTGDPNQLPAAWGGVPAFDILGTGEAPNGSGIVPGGTAGISEGLDVFEIAPAANAAYTLTVTIAGTSAGTFTKTATASMTSTALLPNIASPVWTPDATGNGGGFAITLPAGVTEAYLEIVDFGTSTTDSSGNQLPNCNGASAGAPVFYTFAVSASGTETLTDTAGPGGSQSICEATDNTTANGGTAAAADVLGTWAIGFDYPAYESSYPNSKGVPNPTIVGASGQSDVTISPAGSYNVPAAGGDAWRRLLRMHRRSQLRRH
jgi:hypothetical protein